ncbi:hypothetical protein [Cypionkella sinensis]|uniref:Uncharacterized protein n=1 Tax=Cypionkella sinensis TaxID=1756043 RepID=A0ABV7J1S1_9RHOB
MAMYADYTAPQKQPTYNYQTPENGAGGTSPTGQGKPPVANPEFVRIAVDQLNKAFGK